MINNKLINNLLKIMKQVNNLNSRKIIKSLSAQIVMRKRFHQNIMVLHHINKKKVSEGAMKVMIMIMMM